MDVQQNTPRTVAPERLDSTAAQNRRLESAATEIDKAYIALVRAARFLKNAGVAPDALAKVREVREALKDIDLG
jgi:hypothetical protein